MAISKISSQSKTTEVDATAKLLINAFDGTGLQTDGHLTGIFDTIRESATELSTSIYHSKTKSVLEEKDDRRDEKTRSLFFLVQGYVHHPDQAIKSAAIRVMTMLNKYGLNLIEESYAVETSLLTSLLGDLDETSTVQAIALLPGVAELISELRDSQNDFEAERLAFEKAKAVDTTKSATKIKGQLLKEVNDKLVIYLRAMNMVDEPHYGAFTRTSAEIIANNNSAVKKRQAN